MKRLSAFIGLGVAICAVAYFGAYTFGTIRARHIASDKAPELAWLKQEFNLGDAEFSRICQLHDAYQPHCAEMCKRIDAKNAEIRALLAGADHVTPDIERKLAEAAQLRADCQKAMLAHFFEVSRSMPPEQGKRYLDWVVEKTFLPMQGVSTAVPVSEHDHGDH